MPVPRYHLGDGFQIFMSRIQALELRVESLEHYLNQQSILEDTLGNIIKEIEKQERLDSMRYTTEEDSPSRNS